MSEIMNLKENILEWVRSDAEDKDFPFCETTEDTLEGYQKAIDQLAVAGETEAMLRLFKFRCSSMGELNGEYEIDRFYDGPILSADLEGALKAGYRETVLAALKENLAPHDFDSLKKFAKKDKELMAAIRATQSCVETAND